MATFPVDNKVLEYIASTIGTVLVGVLAQKRRTSVHKDEDPNSREESDAVIIRKTELEHEETISDKLEMIRLRKRCEELSIENGKLIGTTEALKILSNMEHETRDALLAAAKATEERLKSELDRLESKPKPGLQTILVAEDDLDTRRLLTILMEKEACLLQFARDGEDALRLYKYQGSQGVKYSALVLDIHMPGMNGCEVAKSIRALGDYVPVMFLTAIRSPEVDQCVVDVGACLINKPFDGETLKREMMKMLH